jgi:hypothetical protein
MSNDFDTLPLYDPLIKPGTDKMSDVWVDSLSTLFQTLIGYLTSGGIFLPRLTTAQRDALDSPEEGQVIYNTDVIPGPPRTGAPQIWQVKADVGAWRTFTTIP